MCRIIGAIGKELDATFIANVFLELEHLGKDATGFWFPSTNIVKSPKKVTEFLPEVRETFNEGMRNSNIFIGHTRYATHGDPSYNENNHPIESENWIIVHNGVVHMKDIKDYPYKTDTDTENILAYIERFGLEKGLEYCTSGASIILANKKEENTLYVWKTFQSDMAIAYDLDKENIYISSGDTYFWKGLKEEWKVIEKLGGLFTVVERRLQIAEPKGRELWKFSFKDGQVNAEMIAEITIRASMGYYNTSNDYRRWWDDIDYRTCGFYNYTTPHYTRKKDENDHLFVQMGCGDNRPAITKTKEEAKKPKTVKSLFKRKEEAKKEEKPATNISNGSTTKKVKKKAQEIYPVYPGDVVKLRRPLKNTDMVTSAQPALVLSLTTKMQFRVKKVMVSERIVVVRTDGAIFVVPEELLEIVPTPYCIGVAFNPIYTRCKECIHHKLCEEAFKSVKDIPKPNCVGNFDINSDKCMACQTMAYCLSVIEATDYIDAEFKEVNETAIGSS